MVDLARIKSNVAKMAGQNAPETDIDGYIASEGATVDQVRDYKPSGYQESSVPWLDQANAFANSAVDAIPIIGPKLTEIGNNVDAAFASMVEGKPVTAQDRAAINAGEKAEFPVASTAGSVAGAVGPLMGIGMSSQIAGRALGMTGGLGSQSLMGAVSGAGISAADTKARGGSNEQALTNAAFGGALGGAAPIVMKGVGAGVNTLLGRNTPKQVQNVGRALGDDRIDPAQINRQLTDMGPGATVMDLGPNLQAQAGALASVPGNAQRTVRDTVTSRATNASARMGDDISQNIGQGQEIGALTEQIITAQKTAADPLYAAVRDIPVPMTGAIKAVSETPLGKAAFAKAAEYAANDGKDASQITIGLVDYAKQALDDIAGAAKRSGQNNTARQAANMTRALIAEADKIAPGYSQARQAFAGPAAVLDAIDEGRGIFARDLSPTSMNNAFADMTASEKDAYLQGARSALADMIGNSANDVRTVRDLLRKPYNVAKLKTLLGEEETRNMLRAVEREFAFGQTANVAAGNSETARRAASQGEVAPNYARARPIGWMDGAFMAFDKARATLGGMQQGKVNAGMADMLTSSQLTPEQIRALQLSQRGNRALPVAPASVPLVAGPGGPNERKPLRIVVEGAGRL